jgi:hypothetical protein
MGAADAVAKSFRQNIGSVFALTAKLCSHASTQDGAEEAPAKSLRHARPLAQK